MKTCRYSSKGRCTSRVTFLGILVIGAALRLATLNYNDLWHDEFLTIFATRMELSDFLAVSKFYTAPPLYYLLLEGWLNLTGDLFHPRMFTVLWALVGIYFTYLLGRRLFNRNVGLLAALFIALAPYHLRYSQEIRMYIMQTAILTAETLVLIAALRKKEYRYWLAYGVMIAVSLSLKYQSVFYCVAEWSFAAAYALIMRDRRLRTGVLLTALVLVIFLSPVIWLGVQQLVLAEMELDWVAAIAPSDLPRCFFITFIYYLIAFDEAWWMWVLSSIGAALILYGNIRYPRPLKHPPYAFPLLGVLAVGTPLFMFLVSLTGFRIFFLTRYVLIALPPFFILSAALIFRIREKTLRIGLISGMCFVLFMCSLVQSLTHYNPDWRKLTRLIDKVVGEDDLLLANHAAWMSGYYYYSEVNHPVKNFAWEIVKPDFYPEEFYLFQANGVGEIEYMGYPAYLTTMLEDYGDVKILHRDNYYTFSYHSNVDFKEFRDYALGQLEWKEELETRKDFVYRLFAENKRLDNDYRFTPAEYSDNIWAYRYFKKPEIRFTVHNDLEPGYYQVSLRGSTDRGPRMPERDVTITVDDCTEFTAFYDLHRFWYYNVPFQLHNQRDSLTIDVHCHLMVPANYYDTTDDRTLGLRFWWLLVRKVDLDTYREEPGWSYFYDIGVPNEDGVCIGNGIYPFIEEDLGQKYRWTNGHGEFFVIIDEEDYPKLEELVFSLRQNHPDPEYNPEAQVIINGKNATNVTIGKGFEEFKLHHPEQWLHPGINTIQLISPFWVPSQVLGVDDDRELGLQVNYIGLR